MGQVFLTHTKKDEEFCDKFDNICAGVGIRRFRSEFEKISKPSWRKIKEEMNKSTALFFLIGKELVRSQELNDPDWRFTQNWISYEIGLACQMGIDVWAVCDDVSINFPIPYLNNYLTISLKHEPVFDYARVILELYNGGFKFPYPYRYPQVVIENNISVNKWVDLSMECPVCKIQFNLHSGFEIGHKIKCPQCLADLTFNEKFPRILG